jgi:hypothetical protein
MSFKRACAVCSGSNPGLEVWDATADIAVYFCTPSESPAALEYLSKLCSAAARAAVEGESLPKPILECREPAAGSFEGGRCNACLTDNAHRVLRIGAAKGPRDDQATLIRLCRECCRALLAAAVASMKGAKLGPVSSPATPAKAGEGGSTPPASTTLAEVRDRYAKARAALKAIQPNIRSARWRAAWNEVGNAGVALVKAEQAVKR